MQPKPKHNNGKGTKDPVTPVPTIIESLTQKLPAQMDRFWLPASNKLQFEHSFGRWTKTNYRGAKSVYMAGPDPENENACVVMKDGNTVVVEDLECPYDEADHRIIYHV